jgi:tRNA pseudouridine38-40 synthase
MPAVRWSAPASSGVTAWRALQRAWNRHLPPTIVVWRVDAAPEGFHPRHSAISRTYRYTVQCGGAAGRSAATGRSPLTDRYTWFEARPLDVAAMNAVSATLVGTHDFATFGQPPQGENTVRTVEAATWTWVSESPPPLHQFAGTKLVFTITANAFLRQMVRSLVGSLLAVGRGDWTQEQFAAAWAARDHVAGRRRLIAPQGLVLEKVTYPDHLAALIFGNE